MSKKYIMPRSAIFSQVPHTPGARCFDLPRAAQKRPGGAGVIYIHNRKHVAYKHMESNSLRYALCSSCIRKPASAAGGATKNMFTLPHIHRPRPPERVPATPPLLRPRTAPRAQGLWGCRRGELTLMPCAPLRGGGGGGPRSLGGRGRWPAIGSGKGWKMPGGREAQCHVSPHLRLRRRRKGLAGGKRYAMWV